MEIKETVFSGCYRIVPSIYKDCRGRFVKTIVREEYEKYEIDCDFSEEFYSQSKKGVLRGMHFQLPPYDHAKLVQCCDGRVMDVIVDLRKSSKTYGQHLVFHLDSDSPELIYIPKGVAHGFYTLSAKATMVYKTTAPHQPSHDTGILWNSIGVEWPNKTPILSQRDKSFLPMKDFPAIF